MRRFLIFVILLAAAVLGAAFWFTRARPIDPATLAAPEGDPDAGRLVFLAAGCASCHADGGAEVQAAPLLAGGRRLDTAYGTFVTPNISPDPVHGIGGWSVADLASVLWRGVTPDGRHLYPAMPYAAYSRMTLQDVADLRAYLDTLPATDAAAVPHTLSLPLTFRPVIGLWKALELNPSFVAAAPSAQLERGRYLVEALGHCAECHTPRNRFGGLDRHRWMAGAPGVAGSVPAPNITPAALDWSRDQIVWYLESGHSPGTDEAGHEMAAVVAGIGQLPREDIEAIAAYLQGLAPIR